MKLGLITRITIFIISILLINKIDTVIILFIWEFLLISYLASILKSKYSYLLLIHPLFLLSTFWGFEIPFSEIGVGFTFIGKFNTLFESDSGAGSVLAESFFGANIFQTYSMFYLSSVPIIAIKALFETFPDIGFYIWQNIFHLFSITIAAIHLFSYKSLSKNVALIILLSFIISPSFLEINSTLHRYSLMFTGLLISFNSINYHQSKVVIRNKFLFISSFIFGIILILISKPALIMSLMIYIGVILLKKFKIKLSLLAFLLLFILVSDAFGLILLNNFDVLSRYGNVNRTGGSSFSFLAVLFGVGFFFRVLYAALSPFPWIDFSQGLDLYGNNDAFLFIHIFSAITALYLLLSFFFNINKFSIDKLNSNPIIFGFALLLPLRFSSIGFHVYLVPVLPFLAPLLLNKAYRIPLLPVLFFVFALEFSLYFYKFLYSHYH